MGFRLKTSVRTKELFDILSASSSLKPFALSKIAIALSIKAPKSIDTYSSPDANGFELQRTTVTGEFDLIYKSLIEMDLGRSITEDEFYPHYVKLHIDRGMELFYNMYQYSGNSLEKFLKSILTEGELI